MKVVLYIALVSILVLFAGGVLVIYYTQEFDEKLSFVDKLKISDVEATFAENNYGSKYNPETGSYEPSTGTYKYLSSAKAKVGTLSLSNRGYFSQVYEAKKVSVCLEKTDGSFVNLGISYGSNGNALSYNDGYYGKEIIPGSSEEIDVYVTYNPYDYSEFNESYYDSFKQIKILLDDNQQENPIGSYDYYNYGYVDCNSLNSQKKADNVILIVK